MRSKIIITYILGNICYYIGHCASVLCDHRSSDFLAKIYQNFMMYSVWFDDWCGEDIVWERVDDKEN